MKKILFFIDSFPNYSETFLYNQIYFLLDRQFYVELLALKNNPSYSENLHDKIIKYNLFKKCTFLNRKVGYQLLRNIIVQPYYSFKIIKLWGLKKGLFLIGNLNYFKYYSQYDVIHAHYGHVGALVCDLKSIGLFQNTKVICSFHGEDLSHKTLNTHKEKYKNIGRLADKVTVNSKYTKECLINSVGESWSNVEIVPVPVDVNFFKPSKKENTEKGFFNLIFCGRLIELKAPTLAIRIVHELVVLGYPVKLKIIGIGPLYDLCEKLIVELGLGNEIKLLGMLSQEEILSEYEEADLFLLPGVHESNSHKTEAQGLVLQEAQAMRLPVIISNAGGMKYGMLDGVTGLIAEENNVDDFVEKIIFLIDNPILRYSMKDAAKDYVAKYFDVSVIGNRMLDIYGFSSN
ncbi:MAG: glycosyltransferase family 4 protein [Algoriphagus sp.]|uniref:glycosyltransferase family 4 protein n=1 Tax=Algoriphagus sp. TaxID=1872435 RepID=UPI0017E4D13A|nr:glycosyltransferase family 4 protein [Algoriphagus sp.]NVJ86803.1 glycosyltransferase family 4 protein [Algoriphagus sp.]